MAALTARVAGRTLVIDIGGTGIWRGVNLQRELAGRTARPVRVLNDVDLQGYGVIRGKGVELVVALGTGMGSALYLEGRLVPNLELGHHPFRKGRTYEDLVSDAERRRVGNRRWRRRIARTIDQLVPTFNPDRIYVGGGNAKHLKAPLPERIRLFDDEQGLSGGARVWRVSAVPEAAAPRRKATRSRRRGIRS